MLKVEVELKNIVRAADGEDATTQRELRSLFRWLQDAQQEHLSTVQPVRHRAHPGEMGSGLETILALVSTSASLLQLLMSVDSFRQARRPRSQVVIRIHGATAADLEAVRQATPELTVLSDATEEPES